MTNPLQLAELVENGLAVIAKGSDASAALFEGTLDAGKGLAGGIPNVVGKAVDAEPGLAGGIPTMGRAVEAEDALTSRLMNMNPQAPASNFIRAALDTRDSEIIGAVHGAFTLPIEARSLLNGGDLNQMANLLREGSPGGLGQVRSTLDSLQQLGSELPPDPSASDILGRVVRSGVPGYNTWVGRTLRLSG